MTYASSSAPAPTFPLSGGVATETPGSMWQYWIVSLILGLGTLGAVFVIHFIAALTMLPWWSPPTAGEMRNLILVDSALAVGAGAFLGFGLRQAIGRNAAVSSFLLTLALGLLGIATAVTFSGALGAYTQG